MTRKSCQDHGRLCKLLSLNFKTASVNFIVERVLFLSATVKMVKEFSSSCWNNLQPNFKLKSNFIFELLHCPWFLLLFSIALWFTANHKYSCSCFRCPSNMWLSERMCILRVGPMEDHSCFLAMCRSFHTITMWRWIVSL